MIEAPKKEIKESPAPESEGAEISFDVDKENKAVVIGFSRPVAKLAFKYLDAIGFARLIKMHAKEIKW